MHPDQFRKLARRWGAWLILLVVVGAAGGYLLAKRVTPLYQATASVLVIAGPGQTAGTTSGALNINATEATTTAATLLVEPTLLQRAIDRLHLHTTVDTLSRAVVAAPESNSELVDLSVTDPSPSTAAAIANTVVSEYVSDVSAQNAQRINQAGAALESQINAVQMALNQEEQQLATQQAANHDTTAIRAAISADEALLSQLTLNLSSFKATQAQDLETVSVAAAAQLPVHPSSPNVLLDIVAGAALGLLIALAIASLMEFLGQGLTTADDVRERLGVPCLGVVPKFRHIAGADTTERRRPRREEDVVEAYRRLRTNLLFSSPDKALDSVVITSVRAGEGKTCTAANLAVSLASSEKRVLLVDADLRKPDQHRIFAVTLEGGLSDLILQTRNNTKLSSNGATPTRFEHLSLLTSGTTPPNPAELLASKRTTLLLDSISRQYDLTVVDTPPIGVVTDALGLAAEATSVVLIVEAGKTNAGEAQRAIDTLREVGATVAGVVINKAPRRRLRIYGRTYGYDYGYGDRYAYGRKGRRDASAADLVISESVIPLEETAEDAGAKSANTASA